MDEISSNLRNACLADRTISLSVFSVLGSHDNITSSVCPSWTAKEFQTCFFVSILSPMFCALLFPTLLWLRCLPPKLPHPVKSKTAPPCLTSLRGSEIWTQVPGLFWLSPPPAHSNHFSPNVNIESSYRLSTHFLISKLQWCSSTSFMNSRIHWVPPSEYLFADTRGLGNWKSCFPQVPWLMEKKIQHLVADTALCWKWQTQLNLEAETSLPLRLLFCWLNSPVSSNFLQRHISATTLSRLCGQLQPWWYLTTPLGMPNLRDKEPTAAPRVLTKLKCLYQKKFLRLIEFPNLKAVLQEFCFGFFFQLTILFADQSAKWRIKFFSWWLE